VRTQMKGSAGAYSLVDRVTDKLNLREAQPPTGWALSQRGCGECSDFLERHAFGIEGSWSARHARNPERKYGRPVAPSEVQYESYESKDSGRFRQTPLVSEFIAQNQEMRWSPRNAPPNGSPAIWMNKCQAGNIGKAAAGLRAHVQTDDYLGKG